MPINPTNLVLRISLIGDVDQIGDFWGSHFLKLCRNKYRCSTDELKFGSFHVHLAQKSENQEDILKIMVNHSSYSKSNLSM